MKNRYVKLMLEILELWTSKDRTAWDIEDKRHIYELISELSGEISSLGAAKREPKNKVEKAIREYEEYLNSTLDPRD